MVSSKIAAEESGDYRNVADTPGLAAWAREHRVDLVVVGPEAPLVAGLADRLAQEGVPVFGPSAAAAEIEGSKAFAKEVMVAAGFLNDVVEDTPHTLDEILAESGLEVARLVAELTNPSKGSKAPRRERKQIDRNHLAVKCAG